MKAVGGVRQTEAPTVHRYIWKKGECTKFIILYERKQKEIPPPLVRPAGHHYSVVLPRSHVTAMAVPPRYYAQYYTQGHTDGSMEMDGHLPSIAMPSARALHTPSHTPCPLATEHRSPPPARAARKMRSPVLSAHRNYQDVPAQSEVGRPFVESKARP